MSEQRDRNIISVFLGFFSVMFFIVLFLDFASHGLNTLMGYAIPLFFLGLLNLIAPKTNLHIPLLRQGIFFQQLQLNPPATSSARGLGC